MRRSDCDRYQSPMTAAKPAKRRWTVRSFPRSSVEPAMIRARMPQTRMVGVRMSVKPGIPLPRLDAQRPRAEPVDDAGAGDAIVDRALLAIDRGDHEARAVEQHMRKVAAEDRHQQGAHAGEPGELGDALGEAGDALRGEDEEPQQE